MEIVCILHDRLDIEARLNSDRAEVTIVGVEINRAQTIYSYQLLSTFAFASIAQGQITDSRSCRSVKKISSR